MKQPLLLDVPPALETPVMRDVLVAVTALPETFAWRNNVGVARTMAGNWIRFGVAGSADILGCYRGRAIAIETKRPKGGRLDEKQIWFRDAWIKANGVYVVARSVDEALAALDTIP